jgi:hypothetical protein
LETCERNDGQYRQDVAANDYRHETPFCAATLTEKSLSQNRSTSTHEHFSDSRRQWRCLARPSAGNRRHRFAGCHQTR